jgi:long-chain acyl-CoA synthetase
VDTPPRAVTEHIFAKAINMDLNYLRTLPSALRHFAALQPDAVAYTFEGRETTFAQFERHTQCVASALAAAGAGVGTRLAYLGKNSDHYFELLVGASRIGAVMVPVSWRLAVPEVQYILADCEAKLLFLGPESLEPGCRIAPSLQGLSQVIAMEPNAADLPEYTAWRDNAPEHTPDHEPAPQDIALQLYTSGTTGRPKGALLTHRNLTWPAESAIRENVVWQRWDTDDVSLVAMPVAHIGGTGWGLRSMLTGAKGVISREFDPRNVLDFIERDRISRLFIVPAAIQFVLRDPRSREVDYSSLKYMLYGSAPISPALLREGMSVFGCGFVQQYGMTETTGSIVALWPEHHTPEDVPRMRSAGKPLPGVELVVRNADGDTLPAGSIGELLVRSPQNMVGYWKQPEQTAHAIDADGWLRTGDAGYFDEEGFVYIQDRVKDMIISGGENVYPAEVENAILGHPDVAEVAVIGVPDDKWGEAVKAIIVLKAGAEPDRAGIESWVRSQLAAFKVPKSFEFVEALARNPSGKVLRRVLREPYWKGKTRGVN